MKKICSWMDRGEISNSNQIYLQAQNIKEKVINKKLNKWEQQVQTGVLAGLKGRVPALT